MLLTLVKKLMSYTLPSYGATTLSIMTFSIRTLSIMTFSIMTLSMMTFRITLRDCVTQHNGI